MTIETFLIAFTIIAATTSLVTEAMKALLDSVKLLYATNVLVLIVSVIVGGVGTSIWYIFFDIPWTPTNIICIVLMIIANWIGSMLGYDKIMQTIAQIKHK